MLQKIRVAYAVSVSPRLQQIALLGNILTAETMRESERGVQGRAMSWDLVVFQ
jgi:hypothetical protein